MKRLFVLLAAFALLAYSHLSAQPVADKKLQALEKSLNAEQKQLLVDYLDLTVRQEMRFFDPNQGSAIRTPSEIRAEVIDRVAAMPAESAKVFWRDLPFTLKRGFRYLNTLHVSTEERKAAAGLPAAAKEEVAKLLSDDVNVVVNARRKILSYGPACRALVADQALPLSANSAQRLRHEDVLAALENQEAHERRMRVTETALQKASNLEKKRQKPTSTVSVLISRRLCDRGNRNDPYGALCYYNFIHKNNDYKAGVALGFGNGEGNVLGINFYGGQDNRLSDLGKVRYDEVKKAPGPETTAKWWKDRDGPPITAVVGHVYLLHLMDPRDRVDFTVKFKVLDLSSDEWIIIEWESVPQDR